MRGLVPFSRAEPCDQHLFRPCTSMPRIKTDLLEPGMQVVGDVKNIDNMLILPAGAALTERQIDILQAWGVEEIEVEACPETEGSEDPLGKLSPEALERLVQELKALFWKPAEQSPIFQEIFRLMLRRRAAKLTGQVKR